MKKYIITAVLLLALLIVSMGALAGCKETVAPGAAPSSVVPRVTATYDLGKASKQWRHLQMTGSLYTDNGTLTLPQDQSDTLATLAGDTFTTTTLTSPTLTSPTITGTSVVSNRASGNVTSPVDGDGSITVTHGLGGSPLAVFATYAGDPVSDNATLYIHTLGSTTFVINSASDNMSPTTTVYWFAILAHE